MKRKTILSLLMLLSACGGGGNGGNNPSEEVNNTDDNKAGVFKDSIVTGLNYKCGDKTGITNSNGEFYCSSDVIAFSVGSVILGTANYSPLISPLDLVNSGGTRTREVQNIARFLLMLDHDGNPDNGIVISDEVRAIAEYWSQIDFNSTLEISDYISDVASVDNTPHSLPDGDTASAHLEDSLNISSDINSGCSLIYPNTPFCDISAHPTCDTTNISTSSITAGMSYNNVIEVMGCHGVLGSVNEGPNQSIAIYSWGTRQAYDWVITFMENHGISEVYSATKY
jgi:hypothetical protein